MTERNERFLYFDSGAEQPDSNRIIVYATEGNINLLKTCSEWFLDGTFSICPTIFAQLYTIHVKLPSGKAVPVVYAFLPSKSTDTYNRFLRVIDEAIDGFIPKALHVDFEKGMMSELQAFFPSAGILGCNFHYNQCIWRHIQEDRALRDRYLSDGNFNLEMRMFSALAFVPVSDVRASYDALISSAFVQDNTAILSTFLRYFETTWIGRPFNPAMFDLECWNAYSATRANQARTNNQTEGWHSAFSNRVNATHPSFFTLMTHIKKEQGLVDYTVVNHEAQGASDTSRLVYRDRQKRLFNITARYAETPCLSYLRSIAHNIEF